MTYTEHYSVLKKECIDFLTENQTSEQSEFFYADLTFGGGGHTFALFEQNEKNKLVCFDQDPDALSNGRERIKNSNAEDRIELVDSNFRHFPTYIRENRQDILDKGGLDGVLMDLGVSSHHFDKGERGFSFREDAPLDMRMDVDNDDIKTAADIVNQYSLTDLVRIFRDYGEEKFSQRIAEKIVETRLQSPIRTTKELENLIFHCYPKKMRHGRINPATKCFQALRIEVNAELDVLTELLDQVLPLLKVGGRVAVISFHSLEDRIAKVKFKAMAKGETPCEIITKKPVLPSDQEILENSRSRSAKLRVLERVESKKSKNKYAHLTNDN
ncbi:16S rRNA (cytosine(1402)-N(4))-methyltransferase RsmH [Halobacteriovorax sp. GB3]|uniref:16S rRNA (cytosine(1402)-N(4))-methyltransferase RsmH n=1 Tax=Halobacteriovorax sp. GB3 TaxID=2719615 RepID=UPI00236050DA|nr:16S rRNA (cytosine(1402)-N(4))-methyltransferase RsmH [Halobacteriovorax sp. GB3]MDD0854667.1 16S rRNA (cytosine(1402)-N(4))-methyltransferase RsmH [Halobacteriovorax sp. GB3]